jgi:DNA repair ATPase RecN
VENAGLMGERVVNIHLGKDHLFMKDGDSIHPGSFDQGSTSIGVGLAAILRELSGVLGNLQDLMDTLTAPERIADYKRMGGKLNKIRRKLPNMLTSADHSLETIFDNLESVGAKLDSLGELKPELENVAEEIRALMGQWNALEPKLRQVGAEAEKIAAAATDSGTVAQMMAKDSQVKKELDSLSVHAKALLEKIKKKGLDMNVDIW